MTRVTAHLRQRLSPFPLALALMLVLAGPGAAAGPERFASPTGSGTTCSQASPCSFTVAVQNAVDGDTITVMPGNHTAQAWHLNADLQDLHIQGQAGQPRPRVSFSLGGGTTGLWVDTGSLRHLEFVASESDDSFTTLINAQTYLGTQDLVITSDATTSRLIYLEGADTSFLDSTLVQSTGSDTSAIRAFRAANVRLQNVTATATGSNSVAFYVQASATEESSATVRNSLLRGAGPFGDLQTSGAATNTANIDYSAYVPARSVGNITDGGHNQTADTPLSQLIDGTGHLVPGSPLINAGAVLDPMWHFDIDGQARTLGPLPDIGADEAFLPPAVTTGAASNVSQTGATVGGSVTPNGLDTTYRIEFGTSNAYGSSTAAQSAGNGSAPVNVSQALGSLTPGTTYHYRVVATNEAGTQGGSDQTFTTAAEPVPPPTDSDGDGIPDASDPDDDNDGVPDVEDAFPLDATRYLPLASNANDTLNGTTRNDLLCGLLGNDTINGLQGNDTLFGDACNDKLRVGVGAAQVADGNDTLSGSEGNDILYGAGGRDKLDGGLGNDRLLGGGGNDSLSGAAGNDKLQGDAGNDTLSGGSGKDGLTGGTGNDKLNGGAGKNSYKGGSGNDRITAANGQKETVDCGAGTKDYARVDKADKVRGCETVKRSN